MTSELRSTSIHGVFELKCHSVFDARGSFLNVYRAKENAFMSSWGIRGISQVNLSRSVLGLSEECICSLPPTARPSWCVV